ncbi:hypothetical protein [Aliikangiella sp. G2MR2-5]|uniref:WD40/YVTN/BNR-like repeat-containing protein n=1 Tax=Aliikangiella sp. G2MR2-5 TaxID=2788943 RepID=UPI0018AC6418|nr:hypothetical protein [Aliikangiella sp. G2MR2-5]
MKKSAKILLSSLVATIPVGLISYNQLNTQQCGLVFDSEKRALLQQIDLPTQQRLRQERSLLAKELCQIPGDKLSHAINRLSQPKPDMPGEAQKFRYQQQVSENGRLNVKNWNLAREQVKSQLLNQKRDAGINSANWESIGPGNIGGRIRSLAFDPDNSQRIYAGAVAGGVWLTENGGASWQPTDDFMANLSVSTLVVDPNDSNIVYAGTGEGTFNADQVRGLGVFKSTDKGNNWSQLSFTNDNSDFYWVNRLTILPDSSKLVAATHTGIWVSTDAGNNWTLKHSGRSFDVDAHPADSALLVAGVAGGSLYSTDGGETWQSASGYGSIGSARVEIAYARGDAQTVYASVNRNSGEIWKSTDGGQSFSLVNSGEAYLGGQGWYDNALWVDPTDSNHLIVGGIDLWRSVDGGTTLTKISTWWQAPDSAHADHHFILEHPGYDGSTNQQVYFANDGGVYTAPDITVASGSSGWQELNNQLTITQFYGIGVSPDGTVVGGTQDNGTLVYKGDSEGWTTTFGGDGGYSAADPGDSNYLYGEYVYLRIHRSTNGGVGYSSSYIYDDAMDNAANFIAPFILDPNNANRLLGGGDQLWISNNAKANPPSWSSVKPSIGSNISAIAVAEGNSDIIYVGHNDGSLYKTTNGTDPSPIWNSVATIDLPSRTVMRIAIDPVDSNIVYVAFSGYNSGNLWKTVDGGANWEDSTGTDPANLPPAPVRTIAIKPDETSMIYVGTEVGIFASENGGTSWSLENDGPANVSVDELVWGDANTLYAATHGRGIFRINIAGLSFTTKENVALSSVQQSNTQTITGLTGPTSLSITNGEFSIGCDGTFSSETTTVSNDQTICLRHTASSEYLTVTTTLVTLGARTFEFKSQTLADMVPDDVVFTPLVDVALDSLQTSNSVTISGVSNQVNVSVSNGEYSIGCDDNGFTQSSGTVSLSQTLCLRHTSSANEYGTVTTVITLGESEFEFTSRTLHDKDPDVFSFNSVPNVELGQQITSNSVTITGISGLVDISVTNGEYSIGCGTSFTSSAGTISNEQSVCVRHTSSSSHSQSVETSLTIGNGSATFTSTTKAAPSGGGGSFGYLLLFLTGVVFRTRRTQ